MRNVWLFNMVSLDGFFEGPNHDINWHNVDDEFNEFAIAQLHEIGTLVFGRVTYQLMASYWPTREALESDPIVARLMNSTPKIVFSRTLKTVEWENTRLARDAVQEITSLKQQDGKDIAIFGSANLAAGLIRLGLLDEFRIIVNPVLLGQGTPLFQEIDDSPGLTLVRTKTFRNGNVLLVYQPVEKQSDMIHATPG